MKQDATLLARLDRCIEDARSMRGQDMVPETVTNQHLLDIVRSIDQQYWSLKKSGVDIGYTELTKRVCEAHVFSPEAEENWVLQYAYQIVAMVYFGNRSKENARKRRDRELNLKSQEAEYGRDG